MSKFTIGCLMPVSGIVPGMSRDFVKGLEFGFGQHIKIDCQLEVIKEAIGAGTILTVNEIMAKMVSFHDCDMVTGILNSIVAKEVMERVNSGKIPFVLNNLGEFVPGDYLASEFLLYNGMHLWQSQWMLGYQMQQKHGGIPTIAFSNYDGGYQLVESFRRGALAAGAKDVVLKIMRLEENVVDTGTLVEMLNDLEDGHVHLVLCGIDGRDFVKRLGESDLKDKHPISASPFLVGDDVSESIEEYIVGWKNVIHWSASVPSDANKDFIDSYVKEYEKEPSIYSLMGYETGKCLATVFNTEGKAVKNKALAQALKTVQIDGPRGNTCLTLDSWKKSGEHWLHAPSLEKGEVKNQLIEPLPVEEIISEDVDEMNGQATAGWQNVYLCI